MVKLVGLVLVVSGAEGILQTQKTWYNKGLQFECTGCGDCCRVEGEVWFDQSEAAQLSVEAARGLDVLILPSGHRRVRRSSEACYFLKENKCTIHEFRPLQCAAYPFWPRILQSPQNWQTEPCEGINNSTNLIPEKEIDQAASEWSAWLRRFPIDAASALKATERWAEFIVELGLCPWAQTALDQGASRYLIAPVSLDLRSSLDAALSLLKDSHAHTEPIVFLVLTPNGQHSIDFSTFYSLLDDLEDIALDANAQIAGFHPDWLFAGLDPQDPIHFEKRAPFPTISIVREAALIHAEHATKRIADDNARILSNFDYGYLQERFRALSSF